MEKIAEAAFRHSLRSSQIAAITSLHLPNRRNPITNWEEVMALVSPSVDRNVRTAMYRGLKKRCPNCGVGNIYSSYLEVVRFCPICKEALYHQQADDAPPYVVMVIVGHVVVGGLLAVEAAWHPPEWVQLAIWLPVTTILSLWLLPRVKGAIVGIQWAYRMGGFDTLPEAAAPDE